MPYLLAQSNDATWTRKMERMADSHDLDQEGGALKEQEWKAEHDAACEQLRAAGQARVSMVRSQLTSLQEERGKWMAERGTLGARVEAAVAERGAAMEHVDHLKKLRAAAMREVAEAKKEAAESNENAVMAERSRQQARQVAEELMSGDDAAAKLAIVQATKAEMREHWARMRQEADTKHQAELEELRTELEHDRRASLDACVRDSDRALQEARNEWVVSTHKREIEHEHATRIARQHSEGQIKSLTAETDARRTRVLTQQRDASLAQKREELQSVRDHHAEELASKVAAEVVLRETSLMRLRHAEGLRRLACYYRRNKVLDRIQVFTQWRAMIVDRKMQDVAEMTMQHTAQVGATERIASLLRRAVVKSSSRALARWKTFLVMDAAARYRQSAVAFVNRMVSAARVFGVMRKISWVVRAQAIQTWRRSVGMPGSGGNGAGAGDRDALETRHLLDLKTEELKISQDKVWRLKRKLLRQFEVERG